MKYTVKFSREATILECITAEVEVESEEDIKDMLEEGNYEVIESYESDYWPSGEIENIEIVEYDC